MTTLPPVTPEARAQIKGLRAQYDVKLEHIALESGLSLSYVWLVLEGRRTGPRAVKVWRAFVKLLRAAGFPGPFPLFPDGVIPNGDPSPTKRSKPAQP